MTTVKDILEKKGRQVWSIESSRSALQAVEMMESKNIGALIVSSEDSRLAGIISERDCVRKVMLQNRSATETTVAEIMTSNVVVAREDTTTDLCMALMSRNQIRHLPVMAIDTPVGIITTGDLMKHTIEEQSMTIEELESFIFVEQGGEG